MDPIKDGHIPASYVIVYQRVVQYNVAYIEELPNGSVMNFEQLAWPLKH